MPRSPKADPDRDLVLACKRDSETGFQGAFRELYEQYKDRVYNVCYRVTGNASDALDASQETFGIVYRKVSEFRFDSRFSSWIYRVAVNASIDLKRRASFQPAASIQGMQRGGSADSRPEIRDEAIEHPQTAASRQELEVEIQSAIGRLSPKLRVITVLRYIEGLSYEEIGETLGISLGTVKSRLSRAHVALDRELSPVLDKHHLKF